MHLVDWLVLIVMVCGVACVSIGSRWLRSRAVSNPTDRATELRIRRNASLIVFVMILAVTGVLLIQTPCRLWVMGMLAVMGIGALVRGVLLSRRMRRVH